MERLDPEKALLTQQREGSPTSPPETPMLSRINARGLTVLWLCGSGNWGHKWTSNFGSLPVDDNGKLTYAGQMWQHGLAGVDEDAAVRALQHFTQRLDWPPAPAEVRKHALGIPSFVTAATNLHARGTTGFLRLMWQYVDGWQLARADSQRARQMLRDAYELAVEHVLSGKPLPPEPVAALEQEESVFVRATMEQVEAHLQAIRETLGVSEAMTDERVSEGDHAGP